MSRNRYYLLGRSGLRVSRLALGTLTFGTDGPLGVWGSSAETSRAVFDRYLEAGGNFLDTADLYTRGTSETLLGRFIEEAGVRDRVVLATKFTYGLEAGNPNAGGNGRKNMVRALEASLRRLRTDYVDLYLLHTWDRLTPAEEVMRTFDDLVRAGTVRYAGLSDVPAWFAARAQTYAEAHALTPLVNLQLQYSLVERNLEAEFVPLAQTLGMGITAWSPLSGGLLSGKYRAGAAPGEGRLAVDGAGHKLGHFTEQNWRVVAALESVAKEVGRGMAQVALNWAANRPGIGSVIIGATKPAQLEDNLAALDFELPEELRARLDAASARPAVFPYTMFSDAYQSGLHGGALVDDKPPRYGLPAWASNGPVTG